MKKILISILLLCPILFFAQNWIQNTTFPYAGVHHPITFSNSQYGYVVTGSNTDNVYRWEKATDSWVQLNSFPGGVRGYSYGVTYNEKAYMGLGSDLNGYPNDWWEYDMTNDSWTQKANFPYSGRNHPAMVVVGDKIYMGCGSNNNGNLGDWWEYDIVNDTWIQKSDLPGNDRHHPFYFSIGDYAYVGFGHGSIPGPGSNPSASSYIYNDFYKYDPSNDTWVQLANFPSESRVAGTQFSFNGKGYVLSGDGDDHSPLDEGEFWEYDPLTDSWTQLPSHPGDAIWAPGCFVIDCNVYFLLGQNTNTFPGSYPLNVYAYKLTNDCGCTDPLAVNYSSQAVIDDGSCCYIAGCTDPLALNYDSMACYDNGSCIAAILGCDNPTASNYNPSANTSIAFGGALDNLFSTGGYFTGSQHLIFNSSENCIIKSAVFYSESVNTITFELRDNNGIILDDTTHTVAIGQQRLDLNFEVPIGFDLQLGASANSGLYRNNSGANYPYDIGGVISITNSSASSPGYYYFYYNIEVEVPCIGTTTITNLNNEERKVVKIVDLLGRAAVKKGNNPLFYIYNDGTVKKKLSIE